MGFANYDRASGVWGPPHLVPDALAILSSSIDAETEAASATFDQQRWRIKVASSFPTVRRAVTTRHLRRSPRPVRTCATLRKEQQ